jgi:hypothetical protein
MCTPTIEKYGATPANIQWTVVRGDSATLKVEFLEDDEITYFDNEGWTYLATAYDATGDILDELEVVAYEGYVEIKISSTVTSYWGTKYKSVVGELPFDMQVTIPQVGDDITWTPVIGTICVLGDVTPGGSL